MQLAVNIGHLKPPYRTLGHLIIATTMQSNISSQKKKKIDPTKPDYVAEVRSPQHYDNTPWLQYIQGFLKLQKHGLFTYSYSKT